VSLNIRSRYDPSTAPERTLSVCILLCLIGMVGGLNLGSAHADGLRRFLDGRRLEFSTKDHPKAKGVDLHLTYPDDWGAREGTRPNIVQVLASEGGRGREAAIIAIMDMPMQAVVGPQEELARSLFTPEGMRELIPERAVILNTQATEIEGLPAASIEYRVLTAQAGREFLLHAWSLIFLWDGKFVQVQFQIIGPSGSIDELAIRMAEHRPLFELMASTLVLPDRWKDAGEQKTPTPGSGHSNPEALQAQFLQYRNDVHKFTIAYPRGWAMVEATHRETVFKAVSDNGQGIADISVIVLESANAEGLAPSEFVKNIDPQAELSAMLEVAPDATLLEHGTTYWGNQPAYFHFIDCTFRTLAYVAPIRMIQVCTVRGEDLFVITFRAEQDKFDAVYYIFEAIAGGFVFWPDTRGGRQ
jgi:hypothetical protein